MNRNIVYPGAIPLDTDILSPQQEAMIGLGALAAAAFGTGTLVDGLAGTQTTVASMTINIGPGSILSLQEVDANAYGSLGINTNALVKQGVNLTTTQFTLTAPGTSGQSINYLVEAAFSELDGTPVVLPYVNPASPSTPYSGPSNSGTAQNTIRAQTVALSLKAGAAATTGTQTTPATDTGYVPLYVITVAYGQTAITTAQITVAPSAPFIAAKIPAISTYGVTVLTPSGSTTVTPSSLQTFVFPSAASTQTIAAGSTNGQRVRVYGVAGAAVTVASSVSSGSPFIALPDSSVVYSWAIASASQGDTGIDLTWDGTNWRAVTFGQTVVATAVASNMAVPLSQVGPARTAVFYSNGSWTAPAGVTSIMVDAAAGGGGGGYVASNNGAGGGGGAAVKLASYTVVPGTAYPVTIGAAGAAQTGSVAATAGGNTSLGALFTLSGGAAASGNTPGAAGGTGCTAGSGGVTGSYVGNGGNSIFGAGSDGPIAGGFGGGGSGNVGATIGSLGSPGFIVIHF